MKISYKKSSVVDYILDCVSLLVLSVGNVVLSFFLLKIYVIGAERLWFLLPAVYFFQLLMLEKTGALHRYRLPDGQLFQNKFGKITFDICCFTVMLIILSDIFACLLSL